MKIALGCAWNGARTDMYWNQLRLVELTEESIETVRDRTLRKWRKEAPEGARFSLVTGTQLAETGFLGASATSVWEQTLRRAEILGAETVILRTPGHFRPTLENRKRLVEFMKSHAASGPAVAWWAEGLWEGQPDELMAVCEESKMLPVVDPLGLDDDEELPGGSDFYWRILGRRGLRGGFSDYQLELLVEACLERQTGSIFFSSPDMFNDARRFATLLDYALPDPDAEG